LPQFPDESGWKARAEICCILSGISARVNFSPETPLRSE
jgi:hypothetical protein